MGKVRFAYLNLESHPRGNLMLAKLTGRGYRPLVVVEERSLQAEQGRSDVLRALGQLPGWREETPLVEDLCRAEGIEYVRVPDHNGPECEEVLRMVLPEIALLGDTRILRKNIIEIPPGGIINVHPGYLPDVRGNNPYVWALVENLPQGCTAHFIDEGVDTGPILVRQGISVRTGTTYPGLLEEINDACAAMAVEALALVETGMAKGIPQERFRCLKGDPKTFRLASRGVREKATGRLERGEYDYFV
jgi:methionyl-tRNA formyltransferase